MIKLDSISVIINSVEILHTIQATIYGGDFIVIIGPNGAGKTTLFNVLAGQIVPSAGRLLFDKTLLGTNNVSRVHQNPLQGSIAAMSVAENLALALYKDRTVSLRSALDILWNSDLLHRVQYYFKDSTILHKKMGSLSGGQRQLLSFLMATAYPVKLLLLDEPSAALDYKATQSMMQAVQDLAQQRQTAIMLISHDSLLVHKYANKLWLLHNGALVKVLDEQHKNNLSLQEIQSLMVFQQGSYV